MVIHLPSRGREDHGSGGVFAMLDALMRRPWRGRGATLNGQPIAVLRHRHLVMRRPVLATKPVMEIAALAKGDPGLTRARVPRWPIGWAGGSGGLNGMVTLAPKAGNWGHRPRAALIVTEAGRANALTPQREPVYGSTTRPAV